MSEGFGGGREIGDTYLPFCFRAGTVIFFVGSKAHQLKGEGEENSTFLDHLFVHIHVLCVLYMTPLLYVWWIRQTKCLVIFYNKYSGKIAFKAYL